MFEAGEDEFVITRESRSSLKGIRERAGAREATDEEFAAFEAEYGRSSRLTARGRA